MSNRDDTIDALSECIMDAFDELSKKRQFTTGEAMTALFRVLINSAKASPEYAPRDLVETLHAMAKESVGLQ